MSQLSDESWRAVLESHIRSGDAIHGGPRLHGGSRERISAELLSSVIRSPPADSHPKGLQLYGFVITGQLDLDNTDVALAVTLRGCIFEQELHLENASLVKLDLMYSMFPGARLDGSRIASNLDLSYVQSTERFSATQLGVGGVTFGFNASFSSRESFAALFNGAHFGSDVVFARATVSGGMRFLGTTFAGSLDLESATLSADDFIALDLDHARIQNKLDLSSTRIRGEARLNRLVLEGDLLGPELRIAALGEIGLSATSASLGGDVELTGVQSTGLLALNGAEIQGVLNLDRASVKVVDKVAVTMMNTRVKGDVLARDMTLVGGLSVPGGHFGSNFVISGSTIDGRDGNSLFLNRAAIVGNLLMLHTALAGPVTCQGGELGGEVNLSRSTVTTSSNSVAVDFFSSQFRYSLVIHDFTCRGGIAVTECDIGTFLTILDTSIDAWHTKALDLANTNVKTTVQLRDSRLNGSVDLQGMSVGGGIHLRRLALTGSEPVIRIDNTSAGTLSVEEVGDVHTGLSLVRSRIDNFDIGAPGMRGYLKMLNSRDLRVTQVSGSLTDNRQELRSWLLNPTFSVPAGVEPELLSQHSQPLHEFARAFQSAGRGSDARWFHVKAADEITRRSRGGVLPIRIVYKALAGYGYRPWYVVGWLALLLLVAFFLTASNLHIFYPTDGNVWAIHESLVGSPANSPLDIQNNAQALGYVEFNPLLYSAELVAPVPPSSQSSSWRPDSASPVTSILLAIRAISWVLSALLLASVTGLLRKI